jgi:flagellar biosynthetic protein FliO
VPLGRPRPYAWLTLALTALVCALCVPVTASAAAPGFQRDQTPLPAGVTGGSDPAAAQGVAQAGSTGGSALRMLFGLAIVLAIIFGLYKLLKRSADKTDKGIRAHGEMRVISSTPLAQSRALHLVRVGEELVLVGSSEQGVTRIRVYNAEEARRLGYDLRGDLPALPAGPTSGRAGLGAALLETLRKKTAR